MLWRMTNANRCRMSPKRMVVIKRRSGVSFPPHLFAGSRQCDGPLLIMYLLYLPVTAALIAFEQLHTICEGVGVHKFNAFDVVGWNFLNNQCFFY